jgi:hypothetical protein
VAGNFERMQAGALRSPLQPGKRASIIAHHIHSEAKISLAGCFWPEEPAICLTTRRFLQEYKRRMEHRITRKSTRVL